MRSWIDTLTGKTEDQILLEQIDDEMRLFATLIHEDLPETLKGNAMATAAPILINVPFDIAIWEQAVRREFIALKNEDPEAFDEVMNALFDLVEDEEREWEEDDVLQIDFGFHSGERDRIDYFQGFSERPGFNALLDVCEKSGIDFTMYFQPDEDTPGQAKLGILLESDDGRPLLMCLRDGQKPGGSDDDYDDLGM